VRPDRKPEVARLEITFSPGAGRHVGDRTRNGRARCTLRYLPTIRPSRFDQKSRCVENDGPSDVSSAINRTRKPIRLVRGLLEERGASRHLAFRVSNQASTSDGSVMCQRGKKKKKRRQRKFRIELRGSQLVLSLGPGRADRAFAAQTALPAGRPCGWGPHLGAANPKHSAHVVLLLTQRPRRSNRPDQAHDRPQP